MGAPPEWKAPLSTSSAHNGVSGSICTPDSALCPPAPSPSGGVVVVALTRGTKSASKANLNQLLR